MSEHRPALSGSASLGAVALSPRQFHTAVKSLLREAMAGCADGDGPDEAALRRFDALLRETPSLVGAPENPTFVAPHLVDGVRLILERRREEAVVGSEHLLADLLEFVLAYYPEAVPPRDQF
jgi:hypothetical protein